MLLLAATTMAQVGPFVAEGDPNQTDWFRMGLRGKVKSLTEGKNFYEFDVTGRLTHAQADELMVYGHFESNVNDYYYYNADGRLREVIRRSDDNSTVLFTETFTYDTTLLTGESIRRDRAGNTLLRTVMLFNKKGLRLGEVTYDPAGHVVYHTVRSYNGEGRLVSLEAHCDEGSSCASSDWFTFSYDKKGRMIERRRLDEKGNTVYSQAFNYDRENYPVKGTYFYYGPDGMATEKHVIRYDLEGDEYLVETYVYATRTEHRIKYDYKYDANSNWVSRLTIHSDEEDPVDPVSRTLEYYQ